MQNKVITTTTKIKNTPIIKTAPGKLFIIGEYAVTVPNHSAIIAPVPKILTVTLTPSTTNSIYSTQNDKTVEWVRHCNALVPLDTNIYPLVTKTIEIVETYITQLNYSLKNFELYIDSQLDDSSTKQKYGLGSSGAVCIATIKAMLSYYHIVDDPMLTYKLAVITHLALNSNGSFGDLAVCSFNTLMAYTTPNKQWIVKQLEQFSITEVISMDWPFLTIKPLTWPQNSCFLVGWSGSPASSQQLVNDITKLQHTPYYKKFLKQSNDCISQFIEGISDSNIEQITSAITKNRQLLQTLSPLIETPALQNMLSLAERYQSVGKTSGAGGGDCALVLITQQKQIKLIKQAWQENNITPLFTLGHFI